MRSDDCVQPAFVSSDVDEVGGPWLTLQSKVLYQFTRQKPPAPSDMKPKK